MTMTGSSSVPRISIVVPVYNSERYLGQTLQSVQAQTVPDWELIAVDDGSRDGSAALVQEFARRDPRIRLIQQANGGVASARNRGYAEAAAPAVYIAFLDNDDLWEPDTLQTLLIALEARPSASAAHGVVDYIDGDGMYLGEEYISQRFAAVHRLLTERLTLEEGRIASRPHTTETGFTTFAVQNCIVTPGSVLLRRACLFANPLFDASVAPVDDWDLYLRLTRHAPFAYVPQTVLHYRLHTSNASRNAARMAQATDLVIAKTLTSPDNTQEQRRLLEICYKHFQRREIVKRLIWAREGLQQGSLAGAAKQMRHVLLRTIRLVSAPPK
jgi:glycosyltransferase involved in cell wall biosynthesis